MKPLTFNVLNIKVYYKSSHTLNVEVLCDVSHAIRDASIWLVLHTLWIGTQFWFSYNLRLSVCSELELQDDIQTIHITSSFGDNMKLSFILQQQSRHIHQRLLLDDPISWARFHFDVSSNSIDFIWHKHLHKIYSLTSLDLDNRNGVKHYYKCSWNEFAWSCLHTHTNTHTQVHIKIELLYFSWWWKCCSTWFLLIFNCRIMRSLYTSCHIKWRIYYA